jgi:hypothetical protein
MDASKVFLNFPLIQNSIPKMYYEPSVIYYLNSEGTKYIKNNLLTEIQVGAYTQATDGMPLANFYSALGWTPEDLPSKDSIIKATNEIAKVLEKLYAAPTIEESYTGPILFLDQPSCEAFAQSYIPCLNARREAFSSSSVRFRFGGSDNTKIGRASCRERV